MKTFKADFTSENRSVGRVVAKFAAGGLAGDFSGDGGALAKKALAFLRHTTAAHFRFAASNFATSNGCEVRIKETGKPVRIEL